VSAANLADALLADGWTHQPADGRDMYWHLGEDGELVRVYWRNPSFMVRIVALPADAPGHQLDWEAVLFHATEQMVLDAVRAARAHDDDPAIISRLGKNWTLCPIRAMDADPLASFSYERDDALRYVELRVVHDEREQIRTTLYATCEDNGARIYTEPNCPSGVVAAVALG
jgi:hypothetical protein